MGIGTGDVEFFIALTVFIAIIIACVVILIRREEKERFSIFGHFQIQYILLLTYLFSNFLFEK
jgi:hypothetical protein